MLFAENFSKSPHYELTSEGFLSALQIRFCCNRVEDAFFTFPYKLLLFLLFDNDKLSPLWRNVCPGAVHRIFC